MPAVFTDYLARRGLRTPRDASVVGNASEMVGADTLGVWSTAGGGDMFWALEGPWPAQAWCYGEKAAGATSVLAD